MSLYTLRASDYRSVVNTPAGLTIVESTNIELLSFLSNVSVDNVTKRLANDNVAFVAYMNGQPAAFGWMARGKASIGELNHSFVLAIGHRYLWNFRTLPEYRGLGVYPALLQHIVKKEGDKASQFWIIHAPENRSSLRGISKAGFKYIGKLYTKNGVTILKSGKLAEPYRYFLEEMDLQLSNETATSCWNCSSPFLKKRMPTCCCADAGSECVGNAQLN